MSDFRNDFFFFNRRNNIISETKLYKHYRKYGWCLHYFPKQMCSNTAPRDNWEMIYISFEQIATKRFVEMSNKYDCYELELVAVFLGNWPQTLAFWHVNAKLHAQTYWISAMHDFSRRLSPITYYGFRRKCTNQMSSYLDAIINHVNVTISTLPQSVCALMKTAI